jgi:hypothetical protein
MDKKQQKLNFSSILADFSIFEKEVKNAKK